MSDQQQSSHTNEPTPLPAQDETLQITPLGAGNEVGRSCVLLTYKEKTVMFDCGVHPAYSGLASLPFFDEMDPRSIDLILITHFHLDHCAALPYLLEKTNCNPNARIFMTHPTKAIYKTLLSDFVRVSSNEDVLYSEQDLSRTMKRIETLDYHQEMNWNGIRFWAYNAGHVLGAAMFLVEIAGVRVLYTGDFSRQEDRHLKEAEIPPFPPDIIIVESTYGVQVHEPRKIREARFTQKVAEIVRRGGRVLLPVFALGRAQELLLILEEYWEAHPDLQDIPIYYASSLAKRCMSVYQTYINMMNDNIRKRYEVSNPFAFKYVLNVKNIQDFDDSGPCVFMASPGMLQSGLSRELCERWCTDRRNGIILPGYSVEGTLAKHILSEPSTITRLDGKEVPLRCSVDYITFSAHSDFLQTSEFIDRSRSGHIVLVHGEMTEMGRLRNALDLKYNKGQNVPNIRIYTPKNCQTVRLTFRAEKVAKAIGEVAKRKPEDGASMSGILVKRDFNYTLMSPNELNTYTGLKVSRIQQRLVVPLKKPFSQLATELNHLLEGAVLDIDEETKRPQLDILGAIQVTLLEDGESVSVEWCTNYATDILVESIVYLCTTHSITSPPVLAMDAVSVYRSKQPSSVDKGDKDEDFLYSALSMSRKLLEERFGALEVIEKDRSRFQVNGTDVIVDHRHGIVECEQQDIKERVELALRRIHTIMFPIPDYFCECCGC
ncbi:hypothetical protein GpartN1_g7286.t1 [Galdieria partita]|uniref:Cleavage and polyadenylation specificity factor n=1 Tax=Galdieria partita TaxID=83374 RepID=A0A9C7Q465_9RHOD|nr:hypothetical protein GpartN1_g7286.t1 [Galdieria partita]